MAEEQVKKTEKKSDQKKKSKGVKGQGGGKKNKYARNPMRVLMNKNKRAARHKSKMEKQSILSKERKRLIDEAKVQKKMTEGQLKELLGTLNVRRLTAYLDGSYTHQYWFNSRHGIKEDGETTGIPCGSV